MSSPFIIDAHLHSGYVGAFFAPRSTDEDMIACLDRCGIRAAINASDMCSIGDGIRAGLAGLQRLFEQSGRRVHFLGVYDPRSARESLEALGEVAASPGFRGIKIHPSMHVTPADDPSYRPAWEFAAAHDCALLSHSWSASDFNPVQFLSTPGRFESYVKDFPTVRFVLGHSGGRGAGRHEAVRMANRYSNVYMDFAGDIYCYRLLEDLAAAVPEDRILFGSDFPWLDPRSHISQVLLSPIGGRLKRRILCDNAEAVYRLEH
jgi:uncharacterized protein